jgi:hypothetical protein
VTGRFDSPGEVSNAESSTKAVVFIIEDDISMRRSLTNLFQSVGLGVLHSDRCAKCCRAQFRTLLAV